MRETIASGFFYLSLIIFCVTVYGVAMPEKFKDKGGKSMSRWLILSVGFFLFFFLVAIGGALQPKKTEKQQANQEKLEEVAKAAITEQNSQAEDEIRAIAKASIDEYGMPESMGVIKISNASHRGVTYNITYKAPPNNIQVQQDGTRILRKTLKKMNAANQIQPGEYVSLHSHSYSSVKGEIHRVLLDLGSTHYDFSKDLFKYKAP